MNKINIVHLTMMMKKMMIMIQKMINKEMIHFLVILIHMIMMMQIYKTIYQINLKISLLIHQNSIHNQKDKYGSF